MAEPEREYIPISLGNYLRAGENREISQFQLSVNRGDNYPQEIGLTISPLNEDGRTLDFYLCDRIVSPVDRNGKALHPIGETEYEQLPEDTRQRFRENAPSTNTNDESSTTSDNPTSGQLL